MSRPPAPTEEPSSVHPAVPPRAQPERPGAPQPSGPTPGPPVSAPETRGRLDRYSSFYRRGAAVTTVLLLGYALWRMLDPLWNPIAWASVLAFVLYPLQVRLSRRLGGRRGLSAGVLTLLTPFVIISPLSLLTVAFAHQVTELVYYLRGRSPLSFPAMLSSLERYPLIAPAASWVRGHVTITVDQVQQWLTDSAQTALHSAAAMSGSVVLGVAGTVFGFFMMLFMLFFLLRDGRDALRRLTHLIPLAEPRRDRLVRGVSDALRAVIFGTAATALLEGTMVGVGFEFTQLPSPVVFGVLAAIAALVPAVGVSVILVPAILYLAFIGRWGAAILLAFWSVAVVVVEHLVRPIIASRHGEVSTLAAFIGAFGGVGAFGLIGLVIGPVLLTLTVALVRIAEEMVTGADAQRGTAPAEGSGRDPPTS